MQARNSRATESHYIPIPAASFTLSYSVFHMLKLRRGTQNLPKMGRNGGPAESCQHH
jgi:hypothetical protein